MRIKRLALISPIRPYSVGSNQENVNGALIEAGLDYNVAKVEGTSVKAYLRGGAEVWGGNRGTQWRASGGHDLPVLIGLSLIGPALILLLPGNESELLNKASLRGGFCIGYWYVAMANT